MLKAAPDGDAEAAVTVPARTRDSAIGRLGLRLHTSAALHSAMLRRSMLNGLSLAAAVRASHLAHTELSAKRSVVRVVACSPCVWLADAVHLSDADAAGIALCALFAALCLFNARPCVAHLHAFLSRSQLRHSLIQLRRIQGPVFYLCTSSPDALMEPGVLHTALEP